MLIPIPFLLQVRGTYEPILPLSLNLTGLSLSLVAIPLDDYVQTVTEMYFYFLYYPDLHPYNACPIKKAALHTSVPCTTTLPSKVDQTMYSSTIKMHTSLHKTTTLHIIIYIIMSACHILQVLAILGKFQVLSDLHYSLLCVGISRTRAKCPYQQVALPNTIKLTVEFPIGTHKNVSLNTAFLI